jgi:putative iron-dependent peroxidase
VPSSSRRSYQRGILQRIPPHARYLTFVSVPGGAPRRALEALAGLADGESIVVGLSAALVSGLRGSVEGLRAFPRLPAAGVDVPSTSGALWCWLRGDDRGMLFHRARAIVRALAGAFRLESVLDAFRHARGRDLTGYEDGTENPKGAKAIRAAFAPDGSSFAAVQRWVHDFSRFEALSPKARDAAIGRRLSDNKEIDSAPAWAHVKRTAQESFSPEAFVLRRSMPWVKATEAGLQFVAFGASFDAFEVQLRRMVGLEDGIVDALFGFTRPVTGEYYWCPPVRGQGLDLRAVGIR